MRTIKLSVTDEQAKAMADEVRTGRFRDVSELLRAAWRNWEERQTEHSSRELVSALQTHAGRDPSRREMTEILMAQKRARTKLRSIR